jgi:hypothetical protein
MTFNLINKNGVLIKMPTYDLDDNIKDTEIVDNYAKELSIFEAAGRERRKKDIIKWGENRQYYMRTMFYLYLFSRYKQSCAITVQPNCKDLPDICQQYGDIIFALYTWKLSDKQKAFDYEQYQINFSQAIEKCLKKKDLVVVPLRLYFPGSGPFKDSASGSSHANLLIFRKKERTIEVFEPHGQAFGGRGAESIKVRDAYMRFIEVFNKYTTKTPTFTPIMSDQVCPNLSGFQSLEGYSMVTRATGEGGGYCSVWSMFMTELILKNPTVTTHDILQSVFNMLGMKQGQHYGYQKKMDIGGYLHLLMRGYTTYITRKVAKYNQLIFGDKAMNAIKLGNKNVNYEGISKFRQYFGLYLGLQAEAILENITYRKLKNKLEKRKKHPLFSKYGRSDVMEFLDKMIAQQDVRTNFTPVVNPRDMIERIKSLKFKSPCPPGKVRSDKTGRCIKAKTKTQKNTLKNKKTNQKVLAKTVKKCPDGKFYNEKTKRCNKIKPIKKKKVKIARKTKPKKSPKKASLPKNIKPNKPILKKRKRCPNGTRRNPKTRLCEKAKGKKKKTRKRCPKGKKKNPKTGRCVKKDTKKKLKIVQKLRKKHKITIKVKKLGKLKLKQTRKRCPNGTRKDTKTGKCIAKV